MSDIDFSILDLPRHDPIADPDEYLRAAVQWHFGPDTGSRFWLRRAETLDFDPLTEVTTFADLARFPNTVDELRDVPVRDLVPAGYGSNPPTPLVFESGGTTGDPKRVIIMPDWEAQSTEWEVAELADGPDVRGGGFLVVSPSGPHAIGFTQRRLAEALGVVLYTVDLDPRWVKKLAARGAGDEVAAYVEHIVQQAGFALHTQDISMMMTTPPILVAMTRDDDLVEAINKQVSWIKLGGAHLDEDTRLLLQDIFPNTRLLNVYGSTVALGQAHTRSAGSPEEPAIHDGREPYITFTVVDPDTRERVAYGERGQVVMNHVSKSMFIPNNLERDTAIRLPAPDGHPGDSLTDIAPVATFSGEAVIEGVY